MNRERKGRLPTRLGARLVERLGGFRMEVDPHARGLSVTVCGAERVISLSDTAVELLGAGRRIGVTGRELSLTVLTAHTAQVTGRVEDIRLL